VQVDRVIAGTGYEWDLSLLPYLDHNIIQRIRCIQRAPSLNMRFESSVKGLHFIGPMSTVSFGPLFRFVAGADFTVRTLAQHLAGPVPRWAKGLPAKSVTTSASASARLFRFRS
jgi:hypothetical protein